MEFSSGFLLSLSLCLDIGVANIAMITLAMQRGYFQGFALGLGTCVGDLIYAVLALAGLTVLLRDDTGRWVMVDVVPVTPAKTPVTLEQVKADKRFADLALVKYSRLSVQPVSPAHWKMLCKLAGIAA